MVRLPTFLIAIVLADAPSTPVSAAHAEPFLGKGLARIMIAQDDHWLVGLGWWD